jgi:hypothetical protein
LFGTALLLQSGVIVLTCCSLNVIGGLFEVAVSDAFAAENLLSLPLLICVVSVVFEGEYLLSFPLLIFVDCVFECGWA